MSDTSELKQCPKCGGPIPPEAPQGLCPKCLLAQASVPTETVESQPRPAPPSLVELAAAFPQLEILELIGQGGMGFVYKARQPKLERLVALKILPRSSTSDSRFADRFTREGRLLARLNHPNIVIIHDFGQANGFFYLLMEYVDGVNLRQAMRAGRFTPDQALSVVPKICDALQFAHHEGVLHRDIKPENILLDSKGRLKIADFGIAKLIGEPQADAHLTASGGTLGTPHYMAPEQVERPSTVDHRADIYSLGVVFYEMLTGELPLGKFQPPSQKVQVDVRLDDVVLHALEKEPSRRYQQISEVKTAVDNITASPSRTTRPAPPHAAARRKSGLALKAGLVVFLLSVIATIIITMFLPGSHFGNSLVMGTVTGLFLGGLTAISVGWLSVWRSLAAPDLFWRRFAFVAASFVAALVLIPMGVIFIAMLVPAFMKARDAKSQAIRAKTAAREAAAVQQHRKATNNAARLFLEDVNYQPSNPEPGQLNRGFKVFVPPDSLATFLFVTWSNGVPTVEPGFSTYFKVGKAGGIDVPFCSLSCYRVAESREFSTLNETDRVKSLAGWRYTDSAGSTNAVRWNVNLGGQATAAAIKAMPPYRKIKMPLPQNVESGHQLRVPLIEFDWPNDGSGKEGVTYAPMNADGSSPLYPGVVGWWPAEDSTLDAGGTDHGSWAGFGSTNAYAPGLAGHAFVFDGTHRDRVDLGNPTNLRLQVFTIEAWVKRSSSTVDSFDILGADNSGCGGGGLLFSYGRNGYGFGLNKGKLLLSKIDADSVSSTNAITDTNWHHVAVTKSASNALFYIDGLASSAPLPYSTAFAFDTSVSIGSRGDARGGTFYGMVDEITVYRRVLSPAEISAIYKAGERGKGVTPEAWNQAWSGVDLRIFVEPLRLPSIRMLPNEIDMTNYVAARGLLGTIEEALNRITNTPPDQTPGYTLEDPNEEAARANLSAQLTQLALLKARLRDLRMQGYKESHPLFITIREQIKLLQQSLKETTGESSELLSLKTQLAEARLSHTDDHPLVTELMAKIKDLESK